MENEILNSINEVKYILYIMSGTVIFFLIGIIYLTFSVTKKLKTETSTEAFEYLSEEQLDKGQYNELIKDAKIFLRNRPNNLYAKYYIAKAYYYTKDYNTAKKYFEEIINLDATWEKSVESYIDDINAKC